MTADSKSPGLMFWTTVMVLVLLVGYPLSFGPACWMTSRLNAGASAIPVVYRPLTWTMSPSSNALMNRLSSWYAKVGASDDWEWGPVHDEKGRHIGWMWDSTAQILFDSPVFSR